MAIQLNSEDWKKLLSLPVIVAALGYFVDIYDMQLFGIVRIPSLKSLGLSDEEVSIFGKDILNYQMIGLLLGGILWGVLGDKKGRLSVLFGSIITYSLANIACGLIPQIEFMDKVEAYKWLRFIAGIGLAGELGAGITLVSESLPKNLRAIGTSLVAGIGLLGAVVGNFTVRLSGDWTIAYFIGGAMGFALLLLRVGVIESGMYKNITHDKSIQKGNFLTFFTNWDRFIKYLKCIGIGIPTWFCIGILAYFINEFGVALGIEEPLNPGDAVMWAYIGISAGDFLSGFISHQLNSRKKAIFWMMAFSAAGVLLFLFAGFKSAWAMYAICVWLGLGTGYWAMFVTVGAEQFGTNIRATAATTVPNMVRGALPAMTGLFTLFKPDFGVIMAGAAVGLLAYFIGFVSTLTIEETHGKDLDYLEE
ncbi:MFS transporter [Jiulongibacter sediminis]|uniref:MFS transporter n=1 Tax=Jiulongibacter sediminis TaxID=1605367 RepID=A0A0P7BBV3_9BACT|nr:MFS transporter [Jiulongibacter sediminis]KPM47991.1 MFS transporter [Jiulongibacter sediminis]TBX24174.1 MFS transporter [Jiulongibacter sediminis]